MAEISYTQYTNKYKFYGYVNNGGRGGFGRVIKIEQKKTNQVFALKKIQLRDYQRLQRVKNQIGFLNKLSHLPIIRVFEFYIVHVQSTHQKHCCQVGIIMELAQASLADVLKGSTILLKEINIIKFLEAIIGTLFQLQKLNIAHRDIKPANILLTKNINQELQFKLADFGLAIQIKQDQQEPYAGTYIYSSPKQKQKFQNSKIKTNAYKDDVYSLGISTIELLTRRTTINEYAAQIISKMDIDDKVIDILNLMLTQNQDERPDFEQLAAKISEFWPNENQTQQSAYQQYEKAGQVQQLVKSVQENPQNDQQNSQNEKQQPANYYQYERKEHYYQASYTNIYQNFCAQVQEDQKPDQNQQQGDNETNLKQGQALQQNVTQYETIVQHQEKQEKLEEYIRLKTYEDYQYELQYENIGNYYYNAKFNRRQQYIYDSPEKYNKNKTKRLKKQIKYF